MPFIGVQPAATAITATSLSGVTSSAAELNILDGVTSTAAELNILDGVTSTAAELNILDGVTSTAAELNILDGVTSTAAELNILDGVTSTAAELNILDGVTSTAAELNILDGVTATTAELNYLDITTLGGSEASKVLTADSSGNVGIGTASPDQLDVGDHTAAGNRSIRISQRTGTGVQTYGGIEFFYDNTAGTTGVNAAIKYAAGPLRNDGELTFHTGVSASISERLRIDHNGNVGIGTASPASYANYNTLTIQGTNGGEIDWKNSSGTTIGAIYNDATDLVIASDFTNTIASSNIRFTCDGTERMRIAGSGVVGIGISNPTGILHLKSDDNGVVFQSSSSTNSRAQIFFQKQWWHHNRQDSCRP